MSEVARQDVPTLAVGLARSMHRDLGEIYQRCHKPRLCYQQAYAGISSTNNFGVRVGGSQALTSMQQRCMVVIAMAVDWASLI